MKAFPSSVVPRRYLRHGILPQLVTLEAVMRLGSASEAADTLCLAPSTLSGHLHRLGDTLGVTLFEAQGRQLVPTAAAAALLETSREIFAALQRCEARLGGCRRTGMAQRGKAVADTGGAATAFRPRRSRPSNAAASRDGPMPRQAGGAWLSS